MPDNACESQSKKKGEGKRMTMEEIWEVLTRPTYLIIYIAVIVVIMLLIVISVMVNEHRFNAAAREMKAASDRAERERREDEKKPEHTSRFSMLKLYDAAQSEAPEAGAPEELTLSALCEEFRIFAAGRLGLYYDISVIREFIAGLAVSHIVILQGMSGTGKTSLAYAFGEFLDNPSVIIPVQPMWKERTDLLGYYNEFTKRFNETLLLEKMYEANEREEMYITILDELNIARVEYYFAEFLSLLEIPNPEARYLEVVSDKWPDDPKGLKDGRIKLPENMWFVGTANNDDSTFAISDKVYDRAMVLNLDRKSEPFQASGAHTVRITAKQFTSLAAQAVAAHPVSADTMEKLRKFDEYLIEHFQITFGNRIMRQIHTYLPIYMACGGGELDALDDIMTKKVLRKLETQNTAYIRSESEDLCSFLDELFGDGRMARCKEYVRRIARSV